MHRPLSHSLRPASNHSTHHLPAPSPTTAPTPRQAARKGSAPGAPLHARIGAAHPPSRRHCLLPRPLDGSQLHELAALESAAALGPGDYALSRSQHGLARTVKRAARRLRPDPPGAQVHCRGARQGALPAQKEITNVGSLGLCSPGLYTTLPLKLGSPRLIGSKSRTHPMQDSPVPATPRPLASLILPTCSATAMGKGPSNRAAVEQLG